MTTALATAGLTKRFGAQTAVDGVDLDVPAGAVYGFLGPNGSGKTTTIRMALGLVRPTAGTVTLLGRPMPGDLREVLPRVGALVEGPAFHPYLSGRANLQRLDAADRFADERTSKQRIDAALDRVGLLHAGGKRYRAYSLGMRQRLGLTDVTTSDDGLTAALGDVASEHVVAALVGAGVAVRELVVNRARLEDLFIELTGEGFDAGR